MRRRFLARCRIAAPVGRVFAWHEGADALPSMLPPWQAVGVVRGGGSVKPGAEVLLRLGVWPLEIDWLARHGDYEKDRLFTDYQVYGPFAHWLHRHRFEPTADGATILTDDIEYELQGGPLGDLLGHAPAEAEFRRMFKFRHAVTRRNCEEGTVRP
jgi:ligand-binding SRPBCC domain-containing protein